MSVDATRGIGGRTGGFDDEAADRGRSSMSADDDDPGGGGGCGDGPESHDDESGSGDVGFDGPRRWKRRCDSMVAGLGASQSVYTRHMTWLRGLRIQDDLDFAGNRVSTHNRDGYLHTRIRTGLPQELARRQWMSARLLMEQEWRDGCEAESRDKWRRLSDVGALGSLARTKAHT